MGTTTTATSRTLDVARVSPCPCQGQRVRARGSGQTCRWLQYARAVLWSAACACAVRDRLHTNGGDELPHDVVLLGDGAFPVVHFVESGVQRLQERPRALYALLPLGSLGERTGQLVACRGQCRLIACDLGELMLQITLGDGVLPVHGHDAIT